MTIPTAFTTTQSSVIRTAVYSPEAQTLTIVLVGGKGYRYGGIPPSVWEAFYRAPSRGQFYTSLIKRNYPCVQLQETPLRRLLDTLSVERMRQDQVRAARPSPTLGRSKTSTISASYAAAPSDVYDMRNPKYDKLRGKSRWDTYLAELRRKGILTADQAKEERKRRNAETAKAYRLKPKR